MRTVELLPDEALDTAVRRAWDRLDAAGLPSLARHGHHTNRPHLTVAVAATLPLRAVAEALTTLPLPVRVSRAHRFDGRTGMLAWLLVPDDDLMALHRRVWRALDGVERNPLHAPDRWTPHLSLARRLPAERFAEALAVLEAGGDAPAHGELKVGELTVGELVAARSYDTATRTVTDLRPADPHDLHEPHLPHDSRDR